MMDGIEALRALKEGKTVLRYRYQDHHPDYSDYYYRLDFEYDTDKAETSKRIWCKARRERYWHECENAIKFWLFSDNFEIVEGVI